MVPQGNAGAGIKVDKQDERWKEVRKDAGTQVSIQGQHEDGQVRGRSAGARLAVTASYMIRVAGAERRWVIRSVFVCLCVVRGWAVGGSFG